MIHLIPTNRAAAMACLCLTLAGVLAGCCHSVDQVQFQSPSYAIFNPPGFQEVLAINNRADWPAAYSGDGFSEEIAYHEHFIDIQGRGYQVDDGFLYRRFQTDRYGRGRR